MCIPSPRGRGLGGGGRGCPKQNKSHLAKASADPPHPDLLPQGEGVTISSQS